MTKRAKGKNKVKFIYPTLDTFEQYVNLLISIREYFSEDIPAFQTRYKGKLEAIIGQVSSNYFGVETYPDLLSKASYLFYALIKNHPFSNGNKRIAALALYDFIKKNANEVYLDEQFILIDIVDLSIDVSESDPNDYQLILKKIKRKIDKLILA